MSHDSIRNDIEFTLSELNRELLSTAPLFDLASIDQLDQIHTMACAEMHWRTILPFAIASGMAMAGNWIHIKSLLN